MQLLAPENEWKELEEYLQLDQQMILKPIPHRRLYDDFCSGWDKKSLPYQPGELWQRFCDFKDLKPIDCDLMPFPLSAFGEYETSYDANGNGFDRPKEIHPLHSFGLEDPFIWALFRCQEIEAETEDQEKTATLERLNTEATRLNAINPYVRFLQLRTFSKLATATKQLLDRLTAPGAAQRRHPDLQTRRQLRRPQAESLYANLRNAWIMHSFTATVVLILFSTTLILGAEFAWDDWNMAQFKKIMDNTASKQEERELAESWRDTFVHSPQWQHSLYSLLKKSKAEFNAELQKHRESKDTIAWKQAQQVNTEEAITTYLEQYPTGQYAENARQSLGQIMKTKNWQQFTLRYKELLRDSELLEAAKMLEDRPISQEVTEQQIRATFPETAAGLLTTKVANWKERGEWTKAMNYLQLIAQIPADVWPLEQRNSLVNNLSFDIKQAWDRMLYQAACDYRNVDKMNEYVSQAPMGTMKQEVERYLAYLNRRMGSNKFRLILTKVQWNSNVRSESYATYGLNVQNQRATSPQMSAPSRNSVTEVNLEIDFTAKYTDTIPIDIHTTGIGLTGFFGENLIGASDRVNLTVQDISRGGAQLTLRDGSGTETGKAFLALRDGAGLEPELPTWRAQ